MMLLSKAATLTTTRPAAHLAPHPCAGELAVPRATAPAEPDPVERWAIEAFMREQVRQHAWVIDREVAALRTWWPDANLCTILAELVTDPPRTSSLLLAQVDADEWRGARQPADRLAAFQALRLVVEHVPVLLECAVQLDTAPTADERGAREGPAPEP